MRQVKVDLMCPYCGFCQILKVPITISVVCIVRRANNLCFCGMRLVSKVNWTNTVIILKHMNRLKLRAINRAFEKCVQGGAKAIEKK